MITLSRTGIVVLGSVLLMVCFGCSDPNEAKRVRFEMEGRLLKSGSDNQLILSEHAGATSMWNQTGDEEIFDDLSSGDLIHVTISEIAESYPGQTTLYHLELIEEGTEEDLPQDELDTLHELGWTFE